MKLNIDTTLKTITVVGEINLTELKEFISSLREGETYKVYGKEDELPSIEHLTTNPCRIRKEDHERHKATMGKGLSERWGAIEKDEIPQPPVSELPESMLFEKAFSDKERWNMDYFVEGMEKN